MVGSDGVPFTSANRKTQNRNPSATRGSKSQARGRDFPVQRNAGVLDADEGGEEKFLIGTSFSPQNDIGRSFNISCP